MKKLTRLLIIALCALCALPLFACDDDTPSTNSADAHNRGIWLAYANESTPFFHYQFEFNYTYYGQINISSPSIHISLDKTDWIECSARVHNISSRDVHMTYGDTLVTTCEFSKTFASENMDKTLYIQLRIWNFENNKVPFIEKSFTMKELVAAVESGKYHY